MENIKNEILNLIKSTYSDAAAIENTPVVLGYEKHFQTENHFSISYTSLQNLRHRKNIETTDFVVAVNKFIFNNNYKITGTCDLTSLDSNIQILNFFF